MTPELKYFLDYHKTKRRVRWTPLAVAEALSIPAFVLFWLGLGWLVMDAWYH